MSQTIKRETIILVYDRNGKFFQWWVNIDHGINIANQIKGSYRIVSDD